MSNTLPLFVFQQRPQRSLIEQMRRHIYFSVALLVVVLLLSSILGIYISWNQQQLSDQRVAMHDNVNGLLQAMLDQETGLRGYIATNNTIFLQPLTSGRTNYAAALKKLNATTNTDSFQQTSDALAHVDSSVSAWTTTYEDPQISRMEVGNFAVARSDTQYTQGKNLFDALRKRITVLQQASDADLASIQHRYIVLDWISLSVMILLTLSVTVFLVSTIQKYVKVQRDQLANLKSATVAFGEGDTTARFKEGRDSEFNEVGRTFNKMTELLQDQQSALKDRDILEQVMQLNTMLTESLDLTVLMQQFSQSMLGLLDVQIVALYLYDPRQNILTLFSSRGLQMEGRLTTFAFGEGLIGQVAQDREPLMISSREQGNSPFSIKTIMGEMLPASLYHLPLIQSNDLLGVLAVGSVFPMSERTRNVLQVVSSNLATAIGNTQTYQHTQRQATELAEYAHQQELSNNALRQQRDELTVLNSALEEANRVRSQFLSTMSHELRTPLASIIGFSQLIMRSAEKAPLSARQSENVRRILKNAQHLLSLINDVLDIAKMEAGRMDVNADEVNVRELVTAVVDETRSIAIDRKLQLHIEIEAGISTIETDPRKLRQILLNLVSNALKFTEKGSVLVAVTLQSTSPGLGEAGEQIAISIQDTGIGISAEKQEHIFEAFYQVDNTNSRAYEGTGLGLSIVRELTTLLGGKVEIQSQPGRGSTFTVVLPLHIRDQRSIQDLRLNTLHDQRNITFLPSGYQFSSGGNTSQLAALDLDDVQQDKDTRLVIAVDDNPDVLQLIAASLEQSPYRVIGIQDAAKAIEAIQELHPSAITLDIMMPKINGWQILHQLKSNPATASIPVILLTVLEDRSAGYVLGADEYLVKPVARDSLLNVLQQLVKDQPDDTLNQETSQLRRDTSASSPAISAEYIARRDQTDGIMKPILLVHSEPNIHALIDKLMDRTGYVLQRTSDGQALMDIIEKTRPDLLMMLVNMDDSRQLDEQMRVIVEQNSPGPLSEISDGRQTPQT
jgi:two-component system, chemotaxis family, sensor kinase CheA